MCSGGRWSRLDLVFPNLHVVRGRRGRRGRRRRGCSHGAGDSIALAEGEFDTGKETSGVWSNGPAATDCLLDPVGERGMWSLHSLTCLSFYKRI